MAVDEYAGLREDAHEPRRKVEEAWLARRTHGHEEARRHACQITARRTRARAVSVAWQMGSLNGGWRMSLFSFTFDPRAFCSFPSEVSPIFLWHCIKFKV
jgi:hypothetical protein